jgi:oxalate decarboxylase/phosphoglucose isomerase-like protein (cupin superfamily)
MSDMSDSSAPRIGLDPYLDWLEGEGIPVVEDFGVDLLDVPVRPWARTDALGAAVHLKGRGDFVSMFLLELPPAASSAPQRHLYEEVVYVLSGHGSTAVEAADGRRHAFEWGPRSLFAIPLNARYRHFNGSGSEKALLASTTNLPGVMKMFHNEAFIFDNPFRFGERAGPAKHFSGEGDFTPALPGQHMWETCFVPDLAAFGLQAWNERGTGSRNIMFILADGTMHAHLSEMPVGTYKKAHRHGPDFHVMCVTGRGYSLLWYEGERDFRRVDWKHGTVFAPADRMFHQHFNTGPDPARYLATAFGSLRYPFTESKRRALTGRDANGLKQGAVSTSVREGGDQIEFEDQSPRIHEMFLEATRASGVEVRMAAFARDAQPGGTLSQA